MKGELSILKISGFAIGRKPASGLPGGAGAAHGAGSAAGLRAVTRRHVKMSAAAAGTGLAQGWHRVAHLGCDCAAGVGLTQRLGWGELR